MLIQHFILGLPADASDQEIRARYLELVKKHPPETSPVRFGQITEAYEAIKTRRLRIRERIFSSYADKDPAQTLRLLMTARELKRERVGLQELFEAEKTCSKG